MWHSGFNLHCVQALKTWQTGVVGTLCIIHCVCQISDVMRRGTHIMWGLIGRAYMGWYPQEESKHNPPEGLIGVKNTLILWQLMLPKNLVSICDRGSVSWLYFAPLDAHRVQYIINHLWDHVLSRSQLRKKKKSWRKPQVWVTDPCAHFRVCCCARVVRINYKR